VSRPASGDGDVDIAERSALGVRERRDALRRRFEDASCVPVQGIEGRAQVGGRVHETALRHDVAESGGVLEDRGAAALGDIVHDRAGHGADLRGVRAARSATETLR